MTFSLRGPGGPSKVILRTTHAFPTTCAILKSYMSLKNPLNPYCHLCFKGRITKLCRARRFRYMKMQFPTHKQYTPCIELTMRLYIPKLLSCPMYGLFGKHYCCQAIRKSGEIAFSFQLRRIVNRSQRKLPSALEYERCHPNRRCCGHVLVVSFTPVTAPSLLDCTIRESIARFAMRCVCTLNACLSPFHVPIFSRRDGECVSVYSSALLSQAAPRVVSHVSSRLCYA